jgi:protoporphyrinogen/coproporphyrinogen III oxidase
VPFSAREFLRSDIVGWPEKLRVLAEPLTAGARDDESVADLLHRKLGRRGVREPARPALRRALRLRPGDMQVGLSLGHVLKEFGIGRSLLLPLLRRGGRIDPPPACSFREGMQTLPTTRSATASATTSGYAPGARPSRSTAPATVCSWTAARRSRPSRWC